VKDELFHLNPNDKNRIATPGNVQIEDWRQSESEILVIGNELLNGTILDTNSHWLSKRLTALGFLVTRKTTVRDDLSEIRNGFAHALERKPSWLFSFGGLGPTYDDKTLEGLSKAVGVGLSLNRVALGMLRERYRNRPRAKNLPPPKVTKYSLKMVTLPDHSIPLTNREGSAPGVLFRTPFTSIVSLPGIPREMKSIMKDAVFPILTKDEMRFRNREKWFRVIGAGESRLAPVLLRLSKELSPSIYVKSHPEGFTKDGRPILKLQVIANYPVIGSEDIERKMREVVSVLKKASLQHRASFKQSRSV